MTFYLCSTDSCDRPRPADQWICTSRDPKNPGCAEQLRTDVERVPELWKDLTATLSRQDAIGGDGGRKSSEVGLVFKTSASEARWLLANTIGSWAKRLAHDTGATGVMPPARWLLEHIDDLTARPDAGEAVDEIAYAVGQASKAADRPEEKTYRYVGKCWTGDCEAPLYAEPEDVAVDCKECGAWHDLAYRQGWIHAQVLEKLVSKKDALAWVKVLMGRSVPDGTWRQWVHREKLVPAQGPQAGEALFRFGDVQDLAVQWMTRTRSAA
jgi:hypothetical protein